MENPVLLVSLFSAILTGLFVRSVTLDLASGIVYSTLAAVVSFGLTSLILLKTAPKDFPENWNPNTNPSPAMEGEHVRRPVFTWNDIFVLLALFASAGLIYLVPSMGVNLIWADWLAIPIQNYTRIAAAVLLTTFLPGYFLLEALDWRREFKGLEVILLSALLSLFVVPLVAAVASNFGLTPVRYEAPVLVGLNCAVFFAFLGSRLIATPDRTWLPVSAVSGARELWSAAVRSVSRMLGAGDPERLYRNISIVGILGLVLAISYRLFPYPPYLVADQWPHHAAARLYETYGNQIFATGLVPYYAQGRVPNYPQWFHIYLGSLFSVSGAPSVNTYFLISFMNIFGLMALYLLALALFKKGNRAIATVALALALFSGFGWIYQLWLNAFGPYSLPIVGPYPAADMLRQLYQTSISTYDVWLANTFFGSAHPDLTSGLQVMALPAMLILLTLTARANLNGSTRYILVGLLMSLSFLGHVQEGGMFAVILLFAIIFSEKIIGAWKVALATLAGTGLSGAIGFILPDRYYPSLGPFYATLAVSAIAVGVAFARRKLRGRAVPTHPPHARLAIALSAAGLATWVALFLLWRLSGYNAFNIWWDCPACATTVPPYIYPTRFGILGLLAIPAIAFLALAWRDKARGMALIYGFAAAALVLGRLWIAPKLLQFPAGVGIEEFRSNKYLALALTLPTAFFLWRGLKGLATCRRPANWLIAGFFLSLVLSSGFASTILYGEFTTLSYTTAEIPTPDLSGVDAGQRFPGFAILNSHELSSEELAAIQYVVDHLQSGEAVAMMGGLKWGSNSFPYAKVALIGGLLQNQTFSLTNLYELDNRSEIYERLSEARVRFVYLTPQDIGVLKEHQPLFQEITELPIAFANSEVTIYTLKG
jgi:hypothetical protein